MARNEHNQQHKVARKGDESVLCHTLGYGEFSQYDSRCASCWLGHDHNWDHHDANLASTKS